MRLRRLVLAALLTGLASAPALAQDRIDGDTYANPRYGIEIAKPSSWHFITATMILDLAQKGAGAARSPRVDDPVKTAGFAVVLSAVPVLGRGFDPQVIVLVHELKEAPANLVATCEGLRTGMSDPEALSPTREVRLGDRPAARLDFQGLVDGAKVRATALCAVRERRVFVVVGQALAAEFGGVASTFETILGSFKLR